MGQGHDVPIESTWRRNGVGNPLDTQQAWPSGDSRAQGTLQLLKDPRASPPACRLGLLHRVRVRVGGGQSPCPTP